MCYGLSFISSLEEYMSITKDGRAIICGEIVPAGEVRLLRTLADQGEPVIGPQLRTLHEERMQLALDEYENVTRTPLSESSVYTYLKRLKGRGLVRRKRGVLPFLGRDRQFVFWEATEEAKRFFRENDAGKD